MAAGRLRPHEQWQALHTALTGTVHWTRLTEGTVVLPAQVMLRPADETPATALKLPELALRPLVLAGLTTDPQVAQHRLLGSKRDGFPSPSPRLVEGSDHNLR